jgi:hypothetical protein
MGHESSHSACRWPAWLNIAILLLSNWIFIAALSFQAHPGADVVAAVFPWSSAQQALQAVASANATFVRTTAITAVLVVRPDERAGLTRLSNADSWIAIDPQAVAACLTLKG